MSITWRTVNGTATGVVERELENERLLVRLPSGKHIVISKHHGKKKGSENSRG